MIRQTERQKKQRCSHTNLQKKEQTYKHKNKADTIEKETILSERESYKNNPSV